MAKCKLTEDDDDDETLDQPRKLPAIGTNASSHPQPRLTRPIPPKLSAPRRSARATSAPPKPSTAAARSRGRVPSGSTHTLRDLHNQVTSIQSVQTANNLHITRQMDSERAKVAEIQADQRALFHELASSKEAELDKRRQLVDASEELEKLRFRHSQEILEFETQLQKRANEIKELSEELRVAKGDLASDQSVELYLRMQL